MTKVDFGVDSGAGISVLPDTMCGDYPLEPTKASQAGTVYYPAGVGSTVKDLGNRTLECDIRGSSRRMRMHVCNVRKPLIAVSEMVYVGHDVFFSKGRSYAYHKQSKSYTEIVRKNGIYVIEATVKPYRQING